MSDSHPNTNHHAEEKQLAARRRFMTQALPAAALAAASWSPAFRAMAGSALGGQAPADFPAQISLYKQAFRNWSGEIAVDQAWTCAPRSEEEVVLAVNWAWKQGYKVRPRGHGHNWSPLIFPPGQSSGAGVLLVDTTSYLTQAWVDTGATPARVTAQTGIAMQDLMEQLEGYGLGFMATPAPGDITLGGVLAIGGHGTVVPAQGEQLQPGHTYGSISNHVLELTAVVWDPASSSYALKTFRRDQAECGALLIHLGRAFITRATLQVGPNQRLRCQSYLDIPSSELFAAPGSPGRTVEYFLKTSGRIETICYPYTSHPWTKVWTVTPKQPLFSRAVTQPFNYPFSDNYPPLVTDLIGKIVSGATILTPAFGTTIYGVTAAGLLSSADLWGWSKNTLLYVKPTTLRVTANGYAILTSRANVQRVIHDFVNKYDERVGEYQKRFSFPMNGPVEIRVSGLDRAEDVALDGAATPWLSALRPRPDRPDWDTAVWFDILTIPGTPEAASFYREIEAWIFERYAGVDAQARVEWSKGWGYSETAAWDDADMLGRQVPDSLRRGQPAGADWDAAREVLNKYDPARLFTSPLLDRLLP